MNSEITGSYDKAHAVKCVNGTFVGTEEGVVDAIARDLCTFFHQESVLITDNKIRSYYIKEKPFNIKLSGNLAKKQ